MAATSERDFYTVAEVARLLDVSRSTVWRWIQARRLPAQRVGVRKIRIRREDVDRVVGPVGVEREHAKRNVKELWATYDPDKVRAALAATAGSWADLDANRLIATLYRAREEGSRPTTER